MPIAQWPWWPLVSLVLTVTLGGVVTFFVTRATARQAIRDDATKRRGTLGVERQLAWYADTVAALRRAENAARPLQVWAIVDSGGEPPNFGQRSTSPAVNETTEAVRAVDALAALATVYGSAAAAIALARIVATHRRFHIDRILPSNEDIPRSTRLHDEAVRLIAALEDALRLMSNEYRSLLELPPFDFAALEASEAIGVTVPRKS